MNSLFQHILIPVDFTEKNQGAIEAARQLARQNDATVTLLHVIEAIEFPEDKEIKDFYERLRERSTRELDKLREAFKSETFDLRDATIVNNRAKGIVVYAVENDIDLIVMSSHPFSPSHPTEGWGTISYQVAALCPCSIMLVKEG